MRIINNDAKFLLPRNIYKGLTPNEKKVFDAVSIKMELDYNELTDKERLDWICESEEYRRAVRHLKNRKPITFDCIVRSTGLRGKDVSKALYGLKEKRIIVECLSFTSLVNIAPKRDDITKAIKERRCTK